MRPESDGAKRYAQRVFVDVSAFKRVMSQHRVNCFCNFANVKPNSADIKNIEKQMQICVKNEFVKCSLILAGRCFHNMLTPSKIYS